MVNLKQGRKYVQESIVFLSISWNGVIKSRDGERCIRENLIDTLFYKKHLMNIKKCYTTYKVCNMKGSNNDKTFCRKRWTREDWYMV